LNISLVLLSVFLTISGFYYLDLFLLFSLTPFFYLLLRIQSRKRRFITGFFWGVIFFSALCYWLIQISLLGLLVLTLYLALYPGLFSLFIDKKIRILSPFYIASIWVLFEVLRSYMFGGFPWGLLGYAFWSRLSFIQTADLFGVYGISFAIVLVNAASLYIFVSFNKRVKLFNSSMIVLLIVSSFYYSSFRLKSLKPDSVVSNVALAQTNVDSDLKWDLEFYQDNLEKIRLLGIIAKAKGADLIIFPETVLPYSWNRDNIVMDDVREIVKDLDRSLLLGIPYYQEGELYNASLMLKRDGEIGGRYFKIHLVPFGEYLPFKKVLYFLTYIYPVGYYSKGKKTELLKFQEHYFSPLICYESIFAPITREAVLRGSSFLVNQSDEGWFKTSQEIYLNNQIAVFRAIESRRSFLRSTNTGITCLIDYRGYILGQLEPFKADVLVVDIPISQELSIYSRYGLPLLAFACFISTLLYYLWSGKKRSY
jgi:apolipoprotein N-acyltransferase